MNSKHSIAEGLTSVLDDPIRATIVDAAAKKALASLARIYSDKRQDPLADQSLFTPDRSAQAISPYLGLLNLQPGIIPVEDLVPDDGK